MRPEVSPRDTLPVQLRPGTVLGPGIEDVDKQRPRLPE
jgi:hypothetical protein